MRFLCSPLIRKRCHKHMRCRCSFLLKDAFQIDKTTCCQAVNIRQNCISLSDISKTSKCIFKVLMQLWRLLQQDLVSTTSQLASFRVSSGQFACLHFFLKVVCCLFKAFIQKFDVSCKVIKNSWKDPLHLSCVS